MQNTFTKPYPIDSSPIAWLKRSIGFSLFASAFLLVFQPFGLSQVQHNLTIVAAGYGVSTFVTMVLLNVVFPKLFASFFSENNWNISKEISWSLVNVFFIGFSNAGYSYLIGFFPFNVESVLKFSGYALAVGIFPISLLVMQKQMKLEKKFEKKSEEINDLIEKQETLSASKTTEKTQINIPSQNVNESFSIELTDLIFVKSADNYVEIYFTDKNKLNRKLIRNSMKELEICFQNYPEIFRCHKSYFVNIDQVINSSGNAQGLKLHLKNTDELIPVSRSLTNSTRERLTNRP